MRIGGWLIGLWENHENNRVTRELAAYDAASHRYVTILRRPSGWMLLGVVLGLLAGLVLFGPGSPAAESCDSTAPIVYTASTHER